MKKKQRTEEVCLWMARMRFCKHPCTSQHNGVSFFSSSFFTWLCTLQQFICKHFLFMSRSQCTRIWEFEWIKEPTTTSKKESSAFLLRETQKCCCTLGLWFISICRQCRHCSSTPRCWCECARYWRGGFLSFAWGALHHTHKHPTYAHTYTHKYTPTHAKHKHMRTYAHTRAHTHTRTHTRTHNHTHTFKYRRTLECMNTHTYTPRGCASL